MSNEINLTSTFKTNFIDYGFEVIKNRAIPDIRDGLKPVQRRTLFEYFQSGATQKNVKVARLTGNVIGKWHPHGDSAVEEAIVNMSQEWKNMVPLVSIKGNNGSIYGDPAAAGRYIESRTTDLGNALGQLLSPEIVPYEYNYDDSEQLPTILPAQIPVLMLNGATGIAVGLSCSIPTHNPSELMDTVIYYLKHPKATTKDLLDILHGPDFPTGGIIINKKELLNIYETGKGRIRIRGRVQYNKKEHALHIYEVPFTKSGLIENFIADLTVASMETTDKKNKKVSPKLTGISRIDNHSGKDGIDIKISLKGGVDHKQVETQLYALTALEDTFSFDFRALNGDTISRYSLKRYLREYVAYQQTLLVLKYTKEKNRIEKRMEILKGRLILKDVMREVVTCAEYSKSRAHFVRILMTGEIPDGCPKGIQKVVKQFKFTERQAEDIAGLPLYRMSQMDVEDTIKEGVKLKKELAFTNGMLSSEIKRRNEIIKGHENMKRYCPQKRKTTLMDAPFAVASKIQVEETPLFVGIDQYNYLRIEEKPFENAVKTTNKSRLGIFGSDGILWNIHLENTKLTTGRGELINGFVPGVDYVGFVTLPETKEGLFLYDNGAIKRTRMAKFMTKTKATKVASGKIKSEVKLVQYQSIPEGTQTITVNGQALALKDISLQALTGTGTKKVTPSDHYTVTFSGELTATPATATKHDTFDAWCIFNKDGRLEFDWDMEQAKPEGLYVVTYRELLKQELVFVHTDGTAKRVDGKQFAVKTKRSVIKCDKDGMEILYLAPVTKTLLATFDTDTVKRINVSDISKQGKTGGGVRAFYHDKHHLVAVCDGDKSDVPITSLKTLPKKLA